MALEPSKGTATGPGIGTDTLINIQNVTAANNGSVLTGDNKANVLTLGAGDQNASGGNGDDTIVIVPAGPAVQHVVNGGSGSDTLDLSLATQSVTINLATGTASGAEVGTITLLSIENSRGGSAADSLTGDTLANWLDGGAGNDTLIGNGGSDTFAFHPGFGVDLITDFNANQDLIGLSGFGITTGTFASRVLIEDVGADTRVTIDGNAAQSILLSGVGNATNVTIDDFLLML